MGKNRFLAWWFGRAQEISFFNERIDVKMYMYVVGGTMLSLNALSGAVYHYELFGETPIRASFSTRRSSPSASWTTWSSSAYSSILAT